MGLHKFVVNTTALLKYCEFTNLWCGRDVELAVMLAFRVLCLIY